MLHNTIPGSAPGDCEEALDQALLSLLIHDHPGLWSLSELDRLLAPSGHTTGGAEPSRHATEDAVERLYAAGLIHRVGQFVFATNAARAADHVNA
jgi:hypothetical protein